jgi:hypothetical protein
MKKKHAQADRDTASHIDITNLDTAPHNTLTNRNAKIANNILKVSFQKGIVASIGKKTHLSNTIMVVKTS